jgi:hypothetical protein
MIAESQQKGRCQAVIPDTFACIRLHVTVVIILSELVYLNGKLDLGLLYLLLLPALNSTLPTRYTFCNWYLSVAGRILCGCA